MVKKKNIVYLSIIVVIVITFITIILGTSKKAYSQVADIEEFTSNTSTLDIAYYDDTVPSYKQLPMNYVNIASYPGKSAIFEVEGNSNILKKNVNYTSSGTTNNIDIVYYKVTDGSLSYGTGLRSETTDSAMGSSNKIAGKFSLRYNDAAVLNDGEIADVKVEFSNIEFKLGKDPGIANTTNVYISLLELRDTSTWTMVQSPNKSNNFTSSAIINTKNSSGNAAALDIAMSMKISISVLEKGTDNPIDSKYKQTLFGINDLDIVNHTRKTGSFEGRYAASAAGAYAEGVVLDSGFASPVALAHQTNSNVLEQTYLQAKTVSINGESKLRIQGDGTKYNARKTKLGTTSYGDHSTYYSGLIVPANPQGFSFYWYGSEHDLDNIAMGSKLGGLPQVPVTASKICPESNSNCGSISYEGEVEHNFNSTPIYKYTPAKGYKVKDLKVNDEDEAFDISGGSYKFTQLYRDPLVHINSDGTPGESYDTENTYKIEVEFEEDPITVNYRSENGSITGITNETILRNHSPTGTTNVPNEGYTFKYWTNDKEVKINDTSYPAGSHFTDLQLKTVEVLEDTTFTAINNINGYTVTYKSDNHGAVVGTTSETVNYNSNPTGRDTNPNTGYHLVKWTCDKDVTLENGDVKTAGTALTKDQIKQVKVTEDLTFTATHEINNYTVTYKSDNHGTVVGETSEDVRYNESPTGRDTNPNTGYHLVKWTCDKDVTLENGDEKEAGATLTKTEIQKVKVTQDLTFTAAHEIDQFTVTYKSDNHGAVVGETSEDVDYNSNPTGRDTNPNTGYHLVKWTCNKDVTLENGDVKTAGTALTKEQIKQVKVTEDLTFTATHDPYKYRITYELNGGTHGTRHPNEGEYDKNVIIDNPIKIVTITPDANGTGAQIGNATNKAQTFLGWTGEDYQSNAKTGENENPSTAWAGELTKNIYYLNLRSDDEKPVKMIANWKIEDVPLPSIEKDHYNCAWYKEASGETLLGASGDMYTPKEGESLNITVYAKCEKEEYTINYTSDEHGKIEEGKESEKVSYGESPTGTKEEVDEGYNTTGWTCDKDVNINNEDGTKRKIQSGQLMSYDNLLTIFMEEDLTCEVHHKKKTYTVNYTSDEYGKITGNINEEVNHGESPTGTKEQTKTGYHIVGWSCDKERTLKDGTKIEAHKVEKYDYILNSVITENMTCKAVHKPNIYTVTYITDKGGETNIPSEELEYLKNPTVKYTLKDGYSFVGWTCDKNVTLNNGNIIKSGKIIGQTKINIIKVEDNLTCKAETEKLITKNPTTADKIKPYMLTAILTFLGIVFTVLLMEDRKARRMNKN